MKKVRCPKCNSYTVFDETRYQPGQRLVFVCSECNKQFAIRLPEPKKEDEEQEEPQENLGSVIVVENAFHFKQDNNSSH